MRDTRSLQWAGVPLLAAALLAGCGPGPAPSASAPTAAPSAAPATASVPEPTATAMPAGVVTTQEYAAPRGSRPHDVAPALDGGVWYTAQGQAALGYLDPRSGETRQIALGAGSAPHGVIVGPDGAG